RCLCELVAVSILRSLLHASYDRVYTRYRKPIRQCCHAGLYRPGDIRGNHFLPSSVRISPGAIPTTSNNHSLLPTRIRSLPRLPSRVHTLDNTTFRFCNPQSEKGNSAIHLHSG